MKIRHLDAMGTLSLAFSVQAGAACTPIEYTLSPGSISELREFKDLIESSATAQMAGNYLVSISAFRSLLNGPADVTVPVEISQESWELMGPAANGLASARRDMLRQQAQMLALEYQNSRDDYRFWKAMADSFARNPSEASCTEGTAPSNDTPTHEARGPSSGGGGGSESGGDSGPGFVGGSFGGGNRSIGGGGGGIPCDRFIVHTCIVDLHGNDDADDTRPPASAD